MNLRRPAAAVAVVVVAIANAGCGSVGNKQVRIEGGAIASTAAEASELADQRLRNRVPVRSRASKRKRLPLSSARA